MSGPISAYIGFDATASSLHVGNLVQIMTLRRLQQTGHRPIVLMGGGTTKVGDPSDKTTQRPMLSNAEIDANIAGIRRAFAPFLSFGGEPTDAVMVNNADWLDKLGYIEFLREYGVHFTINKMVNLEFVRNRLDNEQPLTFLEFNYMLMQAADFLELNRRVGCTLQFGGSEQWGNIVNGIDLIRRTEQRQAFGVTAPLVTTASGAKMGKTVDGAVWLNAEMRSPYDYWQFWRNTEDGDVGRFLRLFTDLSLERDCAAGGARRRGDQRGQEGAGRRGDDDAARSRRGRSRRRRGAGGVRGGPRLGGPAHTKCAAPDPRRGYADGRPARERGLDRVARRGPAAGLRRRYSGQRCRCHRRRPTHYL